MPNQYAPQFRERIISLARSRRSVAELSAGHGPAEATIYRWLNQDAIDHGEKAGTTTTQNAELLEARRRIRELEHDLIRAAAAIFDEQEKIRPIGSTR